VPTLRGFAVRMERPAVAVKQAAPDAWGMRRVARASVTVSSTTSAVCIARSVASQTISFASNFIVYVTHPAQLLSVLP
jgi:hypothetical protein